MDGHYKMLFVVDYFHCDCCFDRRKALMLIALVWFILFCCVCVCVYTAQKDTFYLYPFHKHYTRYLDSQVGICELGTNTIVYGREYVS